MPKLMASKIVNNFAYPAYHDVIPDCKDAFLHTHYNPISYNQHTEVIKPWPRFLLPFFFLFFWWGREEGHVFLAKKKNKGDIPILQAHIVEVQKA